MFTSQILNSKSQIFRSKLFYSKRKKIDEDQTYMEYREYDFTFDANFVLNPSQTCMTDFKRMMKYQQL
ncbi:unnamed protein product [Paramecium pentaurelia]|uniref:Uncharacterized protein n=1 Tax=Paramecium pentaurelia TaxID=43138 RepID=A0A8S1XPG9_9CILI|nr:unnamed protein product [Paramecium pentaurelia]